MQEWGYKSKEDYCYKNDKYYDYDESNWKDTSFVCEQYRIDFVVFKNINDIKNYITKINNIPKLGIEIDGAKWHYVFEDDYRDKDLAKYGFIIERFAAKLVLENPNEFKKQIAFKIKEFKND